MSASQPPPRDPRSRPPPIRLESLLREARRRKVLSTVALYVLAAWVALQVADLAFPGLGIPEEAIRFVWIGVLVAFPLVLLFSWFYQVSRHGIHRTPRSPTASPDEGGADAGTGAGGLPLRRADYLVLGTLVLLTGAVAYPLGVEITRLRGTGAGALGLSGIPRNSIAVLPLENVTGDPDQEYLAAGLHDALVTTLAKVGALTVKASSSANVYRNVVQPARQTARELGAGHLVEGSVFRTGDHVRINVRLIDAATERNIWSETCERELEDVLTLQGEVARAIAEQVRVEVSPEEAERLATTRKVNPEVYETYLRGMYHLNLYTPDGIRTGLGYLEQAIELDPDDPLAYAGLAQGYTLIGHSRNPPPGMFARAREAAVKALELDPLFPQAHAAMAEIQLYYDWDWEGAERSFLRALQLNPNLEWAHGHFAWHHQLLGDLDGAIEHMRRAQQVAPLTPIFSAWLGWLYWADEQYERAQAEARRSLELNPRFSWGLYVLGGALAGEGRYEEAFATYERLMDVDPVLGRWGLGFTHAIRGEHDRARRVASELAESPGQKDLLTLGLIHAAMGDADTAMEWLERAYDERVDWLPWAASPGGFDTHVRAALDNLRDDPRYRDLVRRLGLPAPPS